MQASDRVTYQGKPLDRLTKERLVSANMMVKRPRFGGERSDITLVQGIGGAPASGGTHIAPGGAADTTPYNQKNRCLVYRLLGGTGYYRPNLPGVWAPHIHDNTCGVAYAPASSRRQVTAYYAGRNALANNGPDTGPKMLTRPLFVAPWTERGARGVYYTKQAVTARAEGSSKAKSLGTIPKGAKFTVAAIVNVNGTLYAINVDGKHVPKNDLTMSKPAPPKPPTPKRVSLRVGTLNFPDSTKISGVTEADRIKVAAAQIKAADLDVVGFQELVGRDPDDSSSSLAERMVAGLGKEWKLVVPTTDFNENYFAVRTTYASLEEQYDDAIIRGGYAGRHVSLIRIDSDAVGVTRLGNTHLVENNRAGAEVQSALAASALSRVGTSQQRILMGDFNTDGPLKGLTAGGLISSRKAKAVTNGQYATYVKYSATKPSTDLDWRIDDLWHSGNLECSGLNSALGIDSNGVFVKPRASDHILTYAAFRKVG